MSSDDLRCLSREVETLNVEDDSRQHPATINYDTPSPRLNITGMLATNITEKFTNAAHQLNVGQLVKDPEFTLLESVGALEIMDRKMDSGFLEPGETLVDDYDFGLELLPEEVIGIIDQLLCHEMAWHMGHPLAQTIFTSFHIDKILCACPQNIKDTQFEPYEEFSSDEPLMQRALRAYCLGLIKTCYFINSRISAGHFYEEEDFVTHTYNRNLLENIELSLILQFLEETIKLVTASEIGPNQKMALVDRLCFRASFLTAVEKADSRISAGGSTTWGEVLSKLPKIITSATYGISAPTAFSEKLQRNLSSTIPPRPIVQISQDNAIDHLKKLCLDASMAVNVFKYVDSHSLLKFVLLFQTRKPQTSVYVRSLLQHYLFSDMIILGSMSIRQVIDDDLAITVLPAHVLLDRSNDEIEIPFDPRHKMAAQMEYFRSRAAGCYLDLLRTICQNRCRMRRTLCHTVVDWQALQHDAEGLDRDMRDLTKEKPIVEPDFSSEPIWEFPLSSWVYYYKICQMEWIVQIGFELEIYQPNELAGMYWYLQYLAKIRSRHLERIRRFVTRSFDATQKASTITLMKQSEFFRSLSFIHFASVESAAIFSFADALSTLFTVLDRYSLIESPPRPYSDDHLRYEVRMKPFMSVDIPEFIPFDKFSRLVKKPSESALDLLNFSINAATNAKKSFEILSKLSPKESFCCGSHESWLIEVKNCLKACIATNISILAIIKAVKDSGSATSVKLKVELPKAGAGYHNYWIVPSVTPIP
ncbi:hypothetical protein K3495_g6783 [Podosphaera aphanis]|nr:hypothetical protein K3495_g6783 [Podosphaera aphanis]